LNAQEVFPLSEWLAGPPVAEVRAILPTVSTATILRSMTSILEARLLTVLFLTGTSGDAIMRGYCFGKHNAARSKYLRAALFLAPGR